MYFLIHFANLTSDLLQFWCNKISDIAVLIFLFFNVGRASIHEPEFANFKNFKTAMSKLGGPEHCHFCLVSCKKTNNYSSSSQLFWYYLFVRFLIFTAILILLKSFANLKKYFLAKSNYQICLMYRVVRFVTKLWRA